RDDFNFSVMAEDGGVLPIYRQAKEQEQQAPSIEAPQPRAPKLAPPPTPDREKEEKQIQAAFMEKAFRTLHEWENFRAEIRKWQDSFTPPQPVDLSPITS